MAKNNFVAEVTFNITLKAGTFFSFSFKTDKYLVNVLSLKV